MKWILLVCVNFLVVNFIFFSVLSSREKMADLSQLMGLKYSISKSKVLDILGNPVKQKKNTWHYNHSGNHLWIEWNNRDKLFLASLSFFRNIRFSKTGIKDNLVFIEHDGENIILGLPEHGISFDVAPDGFLKSIKWFQPWKTEQPREKFSTLMKRFKRNFKLVMR